MTNNNQQGCVGFIGLGVLLIMTVLFIFYAFFGGGNAEDWLAGRYRENAAAAAANSGLQGPADTANSGADYVPPGIPEYSESESASAGTEVVSAADSAPDYGLPVAPLGIESLDGNPIEDTNQFDEEVDSDDELFLASTTSLNSIACLPNGELMISFSTQPAPPPSYLVVTVGDQLLRQLPIDGYYFVGPSPAEMVLRLIVMTEQPDNYERLGEQYSIPACRPSAASPQSAQPNCPPPEFFDPLMNRCRIIGNEQPNEPPPDDGYTPPDD